MKKILSILLAVLLISISFTSNAQTTGTIYGTSGSTRTGVHTNADTTYHQWTLSGNINNYDLLTIVLKGTKTSGTVGGTAVPFGSLDGSRWIQIYDKDSTSSQSFSDGDNDKVWRFDKTRWTYYRIRVYSTGTEVATYSCLLLGRKNPN
jgi:hypothetical protein